MTEGGITLDELLRSRDERQRLQRQLLTEHPGLTLLVATVIMPGAVKRTRCTQIAARAIEEEMKRAFSKHITLHFHHDYPTGYEGWYLVAVSPDCAKRTACRIEDGHPLGRMFDIDVFDSTGIPISRVSIGLNERKCLLCDHEARYCMRQRTHSLQELQDCIQSLVDHYVR